MKMNPVMILAPNRIVYSIPTLILLLISCVQSPPPNEVKPLPQKYAWVEALVQSTIEEHDIPAISIGIVDDGKLTFAKGYGTLDRTTDEKVDEHTIYQIGSDTKKMTAIIAKNLVKEGVLNLDTPIIKYLSEVLPRATQQKLQGVTLRFLLSHQAGIPYRAPSNKRIDGDAMLVPYTEQNLIDDLNNVELEFEPGSKFAYSNVGYAIAGYVCEKVAGAPYATLLKRYVTQPFAMQNTTVELNTKQQSVLAHPYRKDNRAIKTSPWNMGKMTPGGGVYSNINDLSKLMIVQMQAYNKYFNKGDFDAMLILTNEEENPDKGHYGFGLGKSVDKNGVRYGHGGDLDGYASGYVFSPTHHKGLIILTSSGGKWIGRLEKLIQEQLIN